jgi:glycosyltransferase involved in cell wall biosynthesis
MSRSEPLDFSIIVPTRDRPGPLTACLEAIARLDYPRSGFEVIVVDDGSETSMEQAVASFRDLLDLTVLRQAGSGPASARNAGADAARGRFLAFLDDDCTPSPEWLRRLKERFDAGPNRVIGGRTENALDENVFSRASQLLISYLYEYYNSDPENARFLASNNLACMAADFRSTGGFDSAYPRAAAEDRDLCDRLRFFGHRMTYAADAVVYHAHALTFRAFWRQHFNYGRGATRFHAARARRSQQRVRVEPLSFYLDLLRYPFVRRTGRQAPSLAALLFVSQGANALGYFWEHASRWGQDTTAPLA